ncbi:MAG TPA: hypothetical protein VGF45_24665 [Polyangia bacterium]
MSQVRKLLVLGTLLLACSGGGDPPSGGSGGRSGAGGSSTGSGGSGGNTPPSDPNAAVGLFTVRLVAPTQEVPTAYTAVSGKVDDGPQPSLVLWTTVMKTGGCELRTPLAPFCSQGCSGGAVCVARDTCGNYPNVKNVGKVDMKIGTHQVTLEAIGGVYQPPGSVLLPSPPADEGAEITLKTSGGDYPSFMVSSKGIPPLELKGPNPLPFSADQPLKLEWTPGKAGNARVEVRVDISHHGGLKGEITCDIDDTGSLDIPVAMTKGLIDLGVAGFPTVYVTRVAPGETKLSHGRVLLRVESSVERPLKIPNLDSCHEDKDCPAPKKCQKDYKCA